MKIVHSIGRRWEKDQVESLARFGIFVKKDIFSYINLETVQFDLLKDVVMRSNRIYAFGADFDKTDLTSAEWLALTGLVTFGYPQPEDTFDFLDHVYDTSNSCKSCGIILGTQKNPFRIKSDKTKLQAFQLEWIGDEIFVTKELYEAVFLDLGIGSWPVIIHSTGTESKNVVQLDLPECTWDFDMTGMPFETCSNCGQKKFQVRPLDFLPSLNGRPPKGIFRGREFYGSGGKADKRIYISQKLRQEFLERKIAKWHQFYPLKIQ